ncbi:MAG: hypothetical protein ACRCZF_12690 [Gemmataceae bacterium]
MRGSSLKIKSLLAVLFGCGVLALSVSHAADDKEKSKEPSKVDWSKFANAGSVSGEVMKSADGSLTVRQAWKVPSGRGRPKDEHKDTEYTYAEGALIRLKTLPPKLDGNGKKTPYSDKEKDQLKKPLGAPGWGASKEDLKPGTLVEVQLVRPREISATKATPEDLLVKYVMILGEAAIPAKPDRAEKKADPKKEEKKKDEKKEEKKPGAPAAPKVEK